MPLLKKKNIALSGNNDKVIQLINSTEKKRKVNVPT